MRKLLLLLLLFIAAGNLPAQKNGAVHNLWSSFHSYNTVQVLNGSSTTSFAVHSVNGFQSGRFFGGIGTGFDYYLYQSVPLFAEARFNLAQRKGTFQFFGNGGLNFAFAASGKQFEEKKGSYKTGSLFGAGLDYLVPFSKEALIVGLAFSNKQVIQMVDNNVWNPALNRTENIPTKDKYSLNRIAIRLGWMF